MGLGVYPRVADADELLFQVYEYTDKALIPSGWTHPDGDDWSDRAHNWSRGVPITITVPDDDADNPDRVMLIDVSAWVLSAYEVGLYDDEWNAKWGIDPDGTSAWDTASWRDFTGPSIKITVRDDD